jgi:fluoride exporter
MTISTSEFLVVMALIAIGGGLGSMARFWLSAAIGRRFGEAFPWGTLVVNTTGSAAIGVLAAVLLAPDSHAIQHQTVWAGLVVGLVGSFTTVSSFSLHTLALARNRRLGHALANVALSVALCLAAVTAGWLGASQILAFLGAA